MVVGLGWDAVREGKAVGRGVHICLLLTVPPWSTPSACTCVTSACGRRVGTKSQGGISSEKRCFPEYPNLVLSSPETLWGAIPLCYWLRSTQPPLTFPSALQVMGNRRSDEPTKTKKGLSSFLDAARWNRGEPQGEMPSLRPPRPPHTTPRSHLSHLSRLSFQPQTFDTSKGRLMVINGPEARASILGT